MAHPSSSVARTQVLPVTIAPTTHVNALCVLELRELRWIGPVGAAVSTHGPMNVQWNLAGTQDNEPTTPVRHWHASAPPHRPASVYRGRRQLHSTLATHLHWSGAVRM